MWALRTSWVAPIASDRFAGAAGTAIPCPSSPAFLPGRLSALAGCMCMLHVDPAIPASQQRTPHAHRGWRDLPGQNQEAWSGSSSQTQRRTACRTSLCILSAVDAAHGWSLVLVACHNLCTVGTVHSALCTEHTLSYASLTPHTARNSYSSLDTEPLRVSAWRGLRLGPFCPPRTAMYMPWDGRLVCLLPVVGMHGLHRLRGVRVPVCDCERKRVRF